MQNKLKLSLLAATLLMAIPAKSNAQLGVGFYAPEVPIDPLRRFAYAKALAKHLTLALGTPVQGYAYNKPGDFTAARRKRKVHFAILGGVFLATQKIRKVLATGNLAATNWSLMTKSPAGLMALKGKTLQVPNLGRIVVGVIENGLLGGNLKVSQHFRIVQAPNLSSSLTAVKLGKAQVVFAPTNSPGLTKVMARTINIPPPAFVQLDANVSASRAKKAAAAMVSFPTPAGPMAGFRIGGGGYGRVAAMAAKRTLRMVMIPTSVPRLQSSVVNARLLRNEYPQLEAAFKLP